MKFFTDVSTGILYNKALNKAFADVYKTETFEESYQIATDIAMDTVFLSLVTKEGYFDDDGKLEDKLEQAYLSTLKQELFKVCNEEERGITNLLSDVVKSVLKRKFVEIGLYIDECNPVTLQKLAS